MQYPCSSAAFPSILIQSSILSLIYVTYAFKEPNLNTFTQALDSAERIWKGDQLTKMTIQMSWCCPGVSPGCCGDWGVPNLSWKDVQTGSCMLSHFSCVWLCVTLQTARLLCLWDSSDENTGVGCHALLQGIFPTQGSNPRLPHCSWATGEVPKSLLFRSLSGETGEHRMWWLLYWLHTGSSLAF